MKTTVGYLRNNNNIKMVLWRQHFNVPFLKGVCQGGYILIGVCQEIRTKNVLSPSSDSNTGQFTKKVFSDLADGFNIALVDCSTDFSLHSVHFRASTKSKPNHFSCVLLFSQNSRPLRRKYLFHETPFTSMIYVLFLTCTIHIVYSVIVYHIILSTLDS